MMRYMDCESHTSQSSLSAYIISSSSSYHLILFFYLLIFRTFFNWIEKRRNMISKKQSLIEGEVTISWHDMHSNSVVVLFLYSCFVYQTVSGNTNSALHIIPNQMMTMMMMMEYRRCQVNSLFFHWLWRCW